MTRPEHWQAQLDNCCNHPKPPLPPYRPTGIERWQNEREMDGLKEIYQEFENETK